MPTLNWIGKKAVLNHHREVPFHRLVPDSQHSAGNADAENLLVRGDNLLALKALLPTYAGRVKCIYIDPPYKPASTSAAMMESGPAGCTTTMSIAQRSESGCSESLVTSSRI